MATVTERIRLVIDAVSSGASQTLEDLQARARETGDAFDKMGAKVGVSGEALRKGLAVFGDVAIGTALVQGLRESVGAFNDAAEAAGLLASATNATTEEASRFSALIKQYGLDTNDVLEIFSDFQSSVAQSGDDLKKLNFELTRNSQGQVDWVASVSEFLTTVQQIPDATERTRLMFKYFGEEGAKQLSKLLASGKSVAEALEEIDAGLVISDGDLAKQREFQQSMFELSQAGEALKVSVGRALVPALTDLLQVVTPLAQGIAALSPATLGLGAAAVGIARHWNNLAKAAGALRTGLAAIGNAALSPLTVDFGNLGLAAEGAGDKVEKANRKMSKRALSVGAVAALAVAWELVSVAVEHAQDNIEAFASKSGEITDQTVLDYNRSLSTFEKWGLSVKDFASNWTNFLPGKGLFQGVKTLWDNVFGEGDLDQRRLELEKYREEQEKLARASGGLVEAQFDAQKSVQALNDMLIEGGYSQDALASAVANAAVAQHTQNQATEDAKRLMQDYADATWNAYNAHLALINAELSERDAARGFDRSVADLKKAAGKDIPEALDSAAESALRWAEAQVKAQGETLDTVEGQRLMVDALREIEGRDGLPPKLVDQLHEYRVELEGAQIQAEKGIDVAVETIIDEGGRRDAKAYIDSLSDEEVLLLISTGPVSDESVQRYIEKRHQAIIDAEVKLKFNGKYSTQAEVEKEINDLFSQGRAGEAIELQRALNATVDVSVNVDTSDLDAKLPESHEVKVTADTTAAVTAVNAIGDAEIQVDVTGEAAAKKILDGLAKKRDVDYNVAVRGWFAVQAQLDALDQDRDVYYNVHYRTVGSPPPVPNQNSVVADTGTPLTSQVTVQMNDGRLADYIGVSVDGTTARTRMTRNRRYGRV